MEVEANELARVGPAADPLHDRFAVLRQEKILYAVDLADAFSSPARPWSTKRATRWLKRSGIGFSMAAPGERGLWATTSSALKEHYPRLWELVLEREIATL